MLVYLRGGKMKYFKILSFLLIISIILVKIVFSQEPNKSSWSNRYGPRPNNNGGQIRFIATYIPIQNWENYWNVSKSCFNYIDDRIRFLKQTSSKVNHYAGDWLWTNLGFQVLILGFADLNPNGGGLAWVAVKRTYHDGLYITSPQLNRWNRFEVYRNSNASFQWETSGRIIKIEVRNPQNINGWDEGDIWYRFSYQ
jgi:hypothetical protein